MAETPAPPVVDQAVTTPASDTVAAPPPEQTAKAPDPAQTSAADDYTPPEEHRESWNKLPPEERKLFNRVYTQQRQKDAARLKEIESRAALADAYARDPVGTHKAVEAQLRANGLLNGTAETPQDLSKETENVLGGLTEHLGPDAVGLLRKLVHTELDSRIAPVQQMAMEATARHTQAEGKAILAAFEAKHPDWKKHEAKMSELAMQLTDGGRLPTKLPTEQWMEMLYRSAAYDDAVSEGVGAQMKRMQQSAETAEQPTAGVQATRVAHVAPKMSDFKNEREYYDAVAEASKRGVVWERG
jgi:hypothetical protein